MELYLEKEFLDNFYIEYFKETASLGQKKVASLLTEYPEVERYIDIKIDRPEDLLNLLTENPFLAGSNIKPPIPVSSIKDTFFKHATCQQCLIFTAEQEIWFKEAEARGALCFSIGDYQKKIEQFIEATHFKIDLNEVFDGWHKFSSLSDVPFNQITLSDNYILTNKANQKMDENIISFLKVILRGKADQEIKIDIYTKNVGELSPGTDEQIRETTKNRYRKLNSGLANFKKKTRIINNNLRPSTFDFHDRTFLSNFFSIDSGKGFNLLPHKNSNSQILVESIFERYTYKRIKNLFKMHNEYLETIERLETFKFKCFP